MKREEYQGSMFASSQLYSVNFAFVGFVTKIVIVSKLMHTNTYVDIFACNADCLRLHRTVPILHFTFTSTEKVPTKFDDAGGDTNTKTIM